MRYTPLMGAPLTIPTDKKLLEALEHRAASQGKTVPEVAREILVDAVEERSLGERIGHLRGRLDLNSAASDSRRLEIKERNWRP